MLVRRIRVDPLKGHPNLSWDRFVEEGEGNRVTESHYYVACAAISIMDGLSIVSCG